MENMMGICEYCGNEIGVIAENQQQANELASEQCSCLGQRIAQRKNKVKEKIKELTDPQCEALNFIPVDDEIRVLIETLGCMAVEGRIQQVMLKIDGTIITIKSGEKTKVARKFTYEQGGTIE